MAFSISYNIVAVDKISKVAMRISRNVKETARQFNNLGIKSEMAGRKVSASARRISVAQRMMQRGFNGLTSSLRTYVVGALGVIAAHKALKTGMDFEDQIAEVSAITGAAGKDLEYISDASLSLARKTYSSASEVAEGFKLVASAKADLLDYPEKLAEVTEQAILLKNAAGVDLASASMTVGTALNQFGAGAEHAARFVDVLAAGAKFGASEIEDTSRALVKVGTTAHISGLSFEETNAALQALAAGGLKGSMAGTGLAAVLLKAQKAGIDFNKVGLAGGFNMIKEAVDKIKDPAERANAIIKTFGLENVKTIETMMIQAHTLDDLTKKMHVRGIAMEQASVQNQTFSKTMKKLGIVIEEKMIKLFNKLKPALNEAAIGFTKFIDSFGEEEINNLASSLKTIGGILIWIGKAAFAAFNFIAGIGKYIGVAVAKTQSLFTSDLDYSELTKIQQRQLGQDGLDPWMQDQKFLGVFEGDKRNEQIEMNINLTGNTENVSGVSTKATGRKLKAKTNME